MNLQQHIDKLTQIKESGKLNEDGFHYIRDFISPNEAKITPLDLINLLLESFTEIIELQQYKEFEKIITDQTRTDIHKADNDIKIWIMQNNVRLGLFIYHIPTKSIRVIYDN